MKEPRSRLPWLNAQKTNPTESFPFTIHQFQLKNGFRVFAIPFDSPGVVAYVTLVRTGSRDEVESGCSGFAHFFEHMMFKGTKRFSNTERERELMLMGAESNAYTSEDCTVYHVLGTADALERLMLIESDRLKNLAYTEEDLRTEATVILGEYQKDASNPWTALEETMRQTAFRRHTYGHTVIGRLEDIRAMPEKFAYSQQFYARGYTSSRCTLILVGDLDLTRLRSLVNNRYGDWAVPAEREVRPLLETSQTEERSADLEWAHETSPYLYLGYRVPAFADNDPDIPALEVLSQMLFSSSSDLYKKLVLEDRNVQHLSGSYHRQRDPFLFTIVAQVKTPDDLDAVKSEIDRALECAAQVPPDPERLAAVKSNIRYGFAHQLKTPLGIAFALSEFVALTGEPRSLARHVSGIVRVGPEDVLRVANRYFSATNRTVVTLRSRQTP